MSGKKLVFLGFGNSNRKFDMRGYEIWTCNDWWTFRADVKPSRIYQIHENFTEKTIKKSQEKKNRFLNYKYYFNNPNYQFILIEEPMVHIANYRLFDKDKAIKEFGKNFFRSTFSYMFVEAIWEGVQEIVLVGVDLTTCYEYEYQVGGMLKNIKEARKRGIKVIAPREVAWMDYLSSNGDRLGDADVMYGEEKFKEFKI